MHGYNLHFIHLAIVSRYLYLSHSYTIYGRGRHTSPILSLILFLPFFSP